MSYLFTLLLLVGLVYVAFRVLNIKWTPKNIAIATLIVVLTKTVGLATVILWQGAAPVSHQVVLTRFIVALNPDLKALIKSINVKIGDHVKKGDILFELEKAQFQAAVDQYTADLEAAKSEVNRLQAGVELTKATIKRLEAQVVLADTDRDAAQKLLARGSPAVSEIKVLRYTQKAEAAEIAVVEAEASHRQAVAALASGRAKVNSTQGLLDNARSDLDRTTYRAPADGVMINWQARAGTITASLRAAAVGTFMETDSSRIVIVLPQNLLRNVAIGDAVEIAFKSRPGKVKSAKIIRIANYTGEGQLTAEGDVPVIANIGSKGFFAAVAKLDDTKLGQSLGLGAAGSAAIYTRSGKLFHILSWLQIRLVALLFFLP